MDLFEDLPEPIASVKKDGEQRKEVNPPSDNISLGLFDDLPSANPTFPTKNHTNTSSSTGLFDDLPIATNDLPTATNDLPTATNVIGGKRKYESDPDDGQECVKMKFMDGLGCYNLQGYFTSRRGERDEMQDTHVIIDDLMEADKFTTKEISRLAYYAVFDGHAGARASKFCEQNMHNHILDKIRKGNLSQLEKEVKKLLVESYRKVDEEFLKNATKQKPAWKDGTTATTMLVINNSVYVANIGDSKAMLCRENSDRQQVALTLTKDHNPGVYEERMRIQKAGGVVRDGRVMGVLEVSRSIGDGQFKKQGVTCVPDIKRCQLTEKDKFLLLACDGLWKTISPDEVIKIMQEVKEESSQPTESQTSEDTYWNAACNRLANEAIRRLSGDNVTIIIISIKPK